MRLRVVAAGVAVAFVAATLAGCSSHGSTGSSSSESGQRFTEADLLAADLGGVTTRAIVNRNAFGLPAKGLPGEDRSRFEIGDSFFTQNWVIAPASTTNRDGLGPTFNTSACAGCHVNDGRAAPPEPGATTPGLLLRLSIAGEGPHGSPAPDLVYGGQLQDRSVPGVPAEGVMGITTREIAGSFDDGTPYTLSEPTYSVDSPAFGPADPSLMISPRIAPVVAGMGLLEAVPEKALLDSADPNDDDGDGISGRTNTVWDGERGKNVVGRFGWKANVPTVRAQTAGAFNGDIGISSPVIDTQDCPAAQAACAAAPNGGSPEIAADTFDAVVFYTQVLAVPAGRDADVPAVKRGAKVFEESGCASCHTPTLKTGRSDIKVLSDQTIHPFTDLLLHDMGPGLADNRPDFDASGREWRTPPLWGIGLVERINGHTRFLHDGRARSLMEAVLWHGGEGKAARDSVLALPKADRDALVAYLESR